MILIFVLAIAVVLFDQLSKLFIVGFFVDPQVPLYTGMLQYEGDSVRL